MSMWFNSIIREEPYQGLTCARRSVRTGFPARDVHTGAAWLSSARVVRCWVKSRNERNPHCLLPAGRKALGTRTELPVTNRRKVGMTSSHHGPYVLGYTRATMVGTARSETVTWSQSLKADLSSDWSLKPDSMKLESLVIAHQHGAVNTFPGLVHTARHTTRVGGTRSRLPDLQRGAAPKVCLVRGVKS